MMQQIKETMNSRKISVKDKVVALKEIARKLEGERRKTERELERWDKDYKNLGVDFGKVEKYQELLTDQSNVCELLLYVRTLVGWYYRKNFERIDGLRRCNNFHREMEYILSYLEPMPKKYRISFLEGPRAWKIPPYLAVVTGEGE